jgi:hypothetical protein
MSCGDAVVLCLEGVGSIIEPCLGVADPLGAREAGFVHESPILRDVEELGGHRSPSAVVGFVPRVVDEDQADIERQQQVAAPKVMASAESPNEFAESRSSSM